MATTLDVSRADLAFEAGFSKPEFALFRDTARLLDRLHSHLEPFGLRLADMRVDRGAGNVGDYHILVHLFNYWMTIRVRTERIEVTCSDLPRDLVEKFKSAILEMLRAIKAHISTLSFRAFTLSVGLHAKLDGQQAREYLARFVTNTPKNLGPPTSNGVAFYFGAEGDRLFATVTADVSQAIQDGVFIRIHGSWDAARVPPDMIMEVGQSFVLRALESLDLQLPG